MKSWVESKTVWFNVVMLLLLLGEAVAANMGLLRDLIPAEAYPVVAAGISIVNVWLRSITSQPIGRKE